MSRYRASFGLTTPETLAPVNPEFGLRESTIRSIRMADDLGFECLMSIDHVLMPDYWTYMIGKEYHDPFAYLGFVAGMTRRIKLLFGALVVPYRNPFTVAKSIASLDQLSGGRVILGVAVGYLENEFDAFRLPHRERGAMTDEYVRIMKALWTQDETSFTGKYFSFSGEKLWPRPCQQPHPPIWVTGVGARSLRRAVELGDSWFPMASAVVQEASRTRYASELAGHYIPRHATLEMIREGRAELADLSAAAGRASPPTIGIVAGTISVTDRSRAQGEAAMRQGHDFISGSKDQVIEELGRWCEAGVSYFEIGFGGENVREFQANAERFARDIMPAFGG